MDSIVGLGVGSIVGIGVDSIVGIGVDSVVGAGVGRGVGMGVSSRVGATVGVETGATLGGKVGATVTKVGDAVTAGRVGIRVIGDRVGALDGVFSGDTIGDFEGFNVGDTVVGCDVRTGVGCIIVGADEGCPDGILWLAVYTINLFTRVASS